MIANYSIAIIADSAFSSYVFGTLNDLLRSVDRIDQRFIELQNYDGKSGFQYLSVFLISFALGIVGGVFQALTYIRFVIIPKHAVKCDVRAAWGFSFTMLFCFAMIWTTFFDKIKIAGVQYIGMSRVFAWPNFPALASLSSFVISFALFTAASTAVKLISRSGAEREGRD